DPSELQLVNHFGEWFLNEPLTGNFMLYNALGQLVYQNQILNTTNIKIPKSVKGILHLRIQSGDQILQKKIYN
ncbi:MAG: T9SS type A sorting domain-containing protein, partial [Flavobacteriales bacterium]|nr:T9SS type A sorting domain-containing protein [Flavobacteriales bacterium]